VAGELPAPVDERSRITGSRGLASSGPERPPRLVEPKPGWPMCTTQSPGLYSSVALQSRSIKMIKNAGTNVGGKKPWFLWVNYVASSS
jgi:hypothetical protein